MSGGDHPELDESPELSNEEQTKYQSNIGILQWIVTSGRFDIAYAVASLSRFNSRPREGHMKRIRKIFGYIKKWYLLFFLVPVDLHLLALAMRSRQLKKRAHLKGSGWPLKG